MQRCSALLKNREQEKLLRCLKKRQKMGIIRDHMKEEEELFKVVKGGIIS